VRIRFAIAVLVAIAIIRCAADLEAAEYAGVVLGTGVPIPGATVTATRGDKEVVTTTDPSGLFRFNDLDEGEWTVRVEMLGFSTVTQTVSVAVATEPVKWTLTLKSAQEFISTIATPASPASSSSNGAAAPSSTPSTAARRPNASNRSNGSNGANTPASTNTAASSNTANRSTTPDTPGATAPTDPFGTADSYLANGSVNNGAASPFAQMAAFGNNRRGVRSLYNGGIGFQFGTSAWDARPFSFGGPGVGRPSYDDAQVLATFGGPIRIPRWFRNAPNVFVGYQRLIDYSATT